MNREVFGIAFFGLGVFVGKGEALLVAIFKYGDGF